MIVEGQQFAASWKREKAETGDSGKLGRPFERHKMGEVLLPAGERLYQYYLSVVFTSAGSTMDTCPLSHYK